LLSYTSYVLVLTATSDRHARGLANHLVQEMGSKRQRALGIEGMEAAQWILLDFNDVIVHIFQEESRQHYDLDGLWADAPDIPVDQAE
jgi:ribosome-associated protein